MITTSFNDEVDHARRGGFFRPYLDIWRRVARRYFSDTDRIDLWGESPGLLGEALLAVRMAANPGEDYEVVAARIEQEAAKYCEFLRNPAHIGKIILNTKRLHGEPGAAEHTGQMYQVRDPAEGKASVEYTFNRSDRLVLEFIAYDKNDNPLFPIVRTYSDWIGKRKFCLGLGRVFALKMTAGELPQLVRVHANFSSASAEDADDELDARSGLARAARANGDGHSQWPTGTFNWLHGGRLAFALSLHCLIVSLISGFALWHAVASRPPAAPGAALTPAQAALADKTVILRLSDDMLSRLIMYGQRQLTQKGDAVFSDAGGKRPADGRGYAWGAETATVKNAGRADTDDASCGKALSGCGELRMNYRMEVGGVRSSAAREEPYRSPRTDAIRAFYAPQSMPALVDACAGGLCVTLLPCNSLLLVSESDCFEYGEGKTGGSDGNPAHTTPGGLADILNANEPGGAPVKTGGPNATEEGEGMTQSQ